MLSNEIDYEAYRQALARDGVVQVPDILQPDAAALLADCLQRQVRWSLALREGGRSRTIDPETLAIEGDEARRARVAWAREEAASSFGFAYDSYMPVRARMEGRDPGLPLHVVLDFFNSADFLGFARWFGGDPSLRAVNAQATRYLPGHFLTEHDDRDDREGRRFAYVLNLTPPGWQAAWGGLLHFPPSGGQPARTLLPRWNTLSLFRVPRPHEVTEVRPEATLPRLAITGWWLGPSAGG